MRWLKDELGPDRLVAAGSLGAAFALVLFGLAHDPITAVSACLLGGASWTVVLTKLYVSAQVALPDWARGRGLAVFLTFIFGATTAGSAVWGKLSAMEGLPIAYFVAAAGVVLAIPMTWRWKLQTGVGIDFSPAMHWRAPIVARNVENNQGPVVAVVEYRVDANDRAEFLSAVDELGYARKRDGADAWGVYEDVADSGRFIETFSIELLARGIASARAGDQRRRDAPQPGSPTAQRGAAHHARRLPRAPAPALAKARGGPRALSASIKGYPLGFDIGLSWNSPSSTCKSCCAGMMNTWLG